MSKVYIKKMEDKTYLLTILYSKNETHLAITFALRVNFPYVCTCIRISVTVMANHDENISHTCLQVEYLLVKCYT